MKLLFQCIFCLLAWHINFKGCEAEPIRGGTNDTNNEAIWQISYQVEKDGEYTHACGGSIIDASHIVTAAHCFVSYKAKQVFDLTKTNVRVVIGLVDLKDLNAGKGIVKRVDKAFVHKDYRRQDNTGIADIAVIRLKEPLDSEDRKKGQFEAIDLFNPPDTSRNKYENKIGFVAGYGAIDIDQNGTKIFGSLRKILRVEFTIEKCPNYAGVKCICHVDDEDDEKTSEIQGFCHADSGGPLYYKNPAQDMKFELVGIISRASKNCNMIKSQGKPGKITYIPQYQKFLQSVRAQNKKSFVEMTKEQFDKTKREYIVLPDQMALAKTQYKFSGNF